MSGLKTSLGLVNTPLLGPQMSARQLNTRQRSLGPGPGHWSELLMSSHVSSDLTAASCLLMQ